MTFEPFKVTVPASSANLGPGFDTLALALSLRNEFEFSPAPGESHFLSHVGYGDESTDLPEGNLLIRTFEETCAKLEKPAPRLELKSRNRIPFDGGLGSSATAILAGIAAAFHVHGLSADRQRVIELAAEYEDHPDNIGAGLYGGFTAGLIAGGKTMVLSQPVDPELKCLIIHPHRAVNTLESRKRLPVSVSFKDAVYTVNRACFFTMAMMGKRYDLFFEAMRDKLHEPARMHSEMDYPTLKNRLAGENFHGWAISGSGPSVIAFCAEYSNRILATLDQHFKSLNVQYDLFKLSADNDGLLIFPAEKNNE